MLPCLIAVVIIAVVIVLFITKFVKNFTVIRINGYSMLPTYKDGQIRILFRDYIKSHTHTRTADFIRESTGRIFVISPPNERIAIKRLVHISQNSNGLYFWFEGDNTERSRDSRHYGFLRSGDILGVVITDIRSFFKYLLK